MYSSLLFKEKTLPFQNNMSEIKYIYKYVA